MKATSECVPMQTANIKLGLRHSPRIRFYVFFKIKKRDFLRFLADRTNDRAIGTVLRLSSSSASVCDVMYCG